MTGAPERDETARDEAARAAAAAPRRIAWNGHSFAVPPDVEQRFWDRFETGRWEPHTLAAIARLAGPGRVFLDIGAWIGPTTLAAAACGAQVVALEPDPVARATLERAVALNPELAARIRILDAALAPESGDVWLAAARKGKGGDSMSSTELTGAAGGWRAAAITPDQLLALTPNGPLVVCIDIEGGEYRLGGALAPVLARAEAVLLSWHPAVALSGRRGFARLRRLTAILRSQRAILAALRGFDWSDAPGFTRPGALARLCARLGLPLAPLDGEQLFERRR